MTAPVGEEERIKALAGLVQAHLVDDSVGATRARTDQSGRRRFQQAVAVQAARARPPVRLALAALVFGVVATIALFVFWPGRPAGTMQPVSATAPQPVPTFLHADASGSGERVRFPDGSTLDLAPGSSGRIASGDHGSIVTLEEGELQLQVVHREGQDWAVHAGPFVVRVTGTKLRVVWRSSAQRFEVSLTEGSVAIASPLSQEPVRVRSGQFMRAELAGQVQTLGNLKGGAIPVEPAAETADGDGLPAPSAALLHGARESWADLMGEGRFDEVLRAAEARGLEACYAGCGLAELQALGDAARYRGRGTVARRALLAQRKRFAGTPAAASAAFVLGRMAESGGDVNGALGWYDRYLAEAPGGPFAVDALGRKLEVAARTGGAAAAAVARQYLARFPDGAHATTARMVLRKHGSAVADRP